MKYAGVVVLYNPGSELIQNISSYIHALDKLYVIDNSDKAQNGIEQRLAQLSTKVVYVPLQQNRGIATALNVGCSLAMEDGGHWVLTMDQDSCYEPGAVERLIDACRHARNKSIAIFSSYHDLGLGETQTVKSAGLTMVDHVMTSGNLLNLKAFKDVGGFNDALFIDEVDHELCAKLRGMGYEIAVVNDSILHHELGNSKRHRILFFNINCSHHSYVRRYYITRNRIYMSRNFSYLRLVYSLRNIVSLIKIIALEHDKLRKIRAYGEGLMDGVLGVSGRKDFKY